MRPSAISSALVLLTALISSSTALLAIASSPCASKCGNVLDKTSGLDDITCLDREYGLTSKANVYQSCITCQLTSKYVDLKTKQTDLQWALYNLRYAVSWCLFGYPNNPDHGSNPCITSTACESLANSFQFDSLSPNATAYGYCALMYDDILPKCTSCVGQGDEKFVRNFITALYAACKQQPILGATISIEGSLFSKVRANITDPNATVDSSRRVATSEGLPLGAKVGIAVGALAVVLAVLGCCIVVRGKQRRRKELAKRQRQSGYTDWVAAQVAQRSPVSGNPSSAHPFFDSPNSARPLFPNQSWGGHRPDVYEESPISAHTGEKTFSPYTSNYSSPVSAHDNIQVVGREWPSDRPGNFVNASALGNNRTRSRSREKQGDKIEMQNVAPVLLHPGMGRRI